MNIYGDMRICVKCKNHADVVENGKDYCAECWWDSFSNTGVKLEDYHKQQDKTKEQDNDFKRKTDIKRFEEV